MPSSSEATSLADVLALPKFVDFEVHDGGLAELITTLCLIPMVEGIVQLL